MSVVVSRITRSDTETQCRTQALIEAAAARYEISYEVKGSAIADDANAWLAASLFPAMKLGETLRLEGLLDNQLLQGASRLQDIFHVWYPDLRKVSIESRLSDSSKKERPIATHAVGCFFSGGVDSFYSILKHKEEITHLLFIHGFDIRLDDQKIYQASLKAVHEVAEALGKEVIEIRTNLRDFGDRYVKWGEHYFGAALASTALLLSCQLKKVYLPSSHTYEHLHPWGSHPLLDPLWSTETMEIVHDGCEASRIEKIAQIASYDMVRKSLRVCWLNWDRAYNCGRCEKCLRTMTSLRALGVSDMPTFNRALDLSLVSRLDGSNPTTRIFIQENLKAAEESNDVSLAKALRKALNGRYSRIVRNGSERILRKLRPLFK